MKINQTKIWCSEKFSFSYLFVFNLDQDVLTKLFKFITGATTVPPLGLPKGITVKFKHGCPAECKCRPTISTCDISITFPVHYSGPEEFKKYLEFAMVEGVGFGNL